MCCLLKPGLSKDTWCHVRQYNTLFVYTEINYCEVPSTSTAQGSKRVRQSHRKSNYFFNRNTACMD